MPHSVSEVYISPPELGEWAQLPEGGTSIQPANQGEIGPVLAELRRNQHSCLRRDSTDDCKLIEFPALVCSPNVEEIIMATKTRRAWVPAISFVWWTIKLNDLSPKGIRQTNFVQYINFIPPHERPPSRYHGFFTHAVASVEEISKSIPTDEKGSSGGGYAYCISTAVWVGQDHPESGDGDGVCERLASTRRSSDAAVSDPPYRAWPNWIIWSGCFFLMCSTCGGLCRGGDVPYGFPVLDHVCYRDLMGQVFGRKGGRVMVLETWYTFQFD
ncbi:hypothetical protein BD779DRAFT_1472304 [Infundibulicybe gibba]|nr:hypothetical protein BD779DRAFT_1472304 [Infundibulicybe gibba]